MLGFNVFYKMKIKYLFVIIIIISLSFYLIQEYILFSNTFKLPVILWWTPGIFPGETETVTCGQYSCVFTNDRVFRNQTDVFLFYGSEFNTSDLPLPKKGKWALIHEESPRNEGIFLGRKIWKIFDITSTFSRYSDYPITLQYLNSLQTLLDKKYFIKTQEKNNLLNKLAPIIYLQSDCDTPIDRDDIIKELMKYISIDSYGKCLKNKNLPPEVADIYPLDYYNEKLLEFIGKYKFVIAIENGVCDDYITEKLWRPLMVGSVPIYYGSSTVSDWLPNNKSAILLNDFKSIKDLADFIRKLNENDDLYEEFLQHKISGKVDNIRLKKKLDEGPYGLNTEFDNPIQAFECFVCAEIHQDLVDKSIDRSKLIYNCPPPKKGNNWELHWEFGNCRANVLYDVIKKNGVKFDDSKCIKTIENSYN